MKQISDQTKLHLPPQKVKKFCGDTRIRATLSGSDCKGMFLVNQLNTNNVFIYSRIKNFCNIKNKNFCNIFTKETKTKYKLKHNKDVECESSPRLNLIKNQKFVVVVNVNYIHFMICFVHSLTLPLSFQTLNVLKLYI